MNMVVKLCCSDIKNNFAQSSLSLSKVPESIVIVNSILLRGFSESLSWFALELQVHRIRVRTKLNFKLKMKLEWGTKNHAVLVGTSKKSRITKQICVLMSTEQRIPLPWKDTFLLNNGHKRQIYSEQNKWASSCTVVVYCSNV